MYIMDIPGLKNNSVIIERGFLFYLERSGILSWRLLSATRKAIGKPKEELPSQFSLVGT